MVAAFVRPITRVQQHAVISTVVMTLDDSILKEALSAFSADEQYNTVLLSILSGSGRDAETRAKSLQLIDEMSERNLDLSSAALTTLLDGEMASGDSTEGLLVSLLAARRNGVCSAFGAADAWSPAPVPPLPAMLELPTDKGAAAVAQATAAATAVTAAAAAAHAPVALVGMGLAGGWSLDRYTQRGEFFENIGKGFNRMLSRDLRSECAVEAACFVLGYLLGLPSCGLAPTAEGALAMLADGRRWWLSPGAPDRLVDRVLIWLLAPAALELAAQRAGVTSAEALELLAKRAGEASIEARAFLEAARRREASLGVDPQQGGWVVNAEEDERRLRYAYAEARRLVTRFSGVIETVEERMTEGISFGACAVLLEGRLKGVLAEPPQRGVRQVLQGQGQRQVQGQPQLGEAVAMSEGEPQAQQEQQQEEEEVVVQLQFKMRPPGPSVLDLSPAPIEPPAPEELDQQAAEERVKALEAKLAALRKQREDL